MDYKSLFNKWRTELTSENRPDEYETKQLMVLAGLPVPQQHLIKPGEKTIPVAINPPYVLKLCSPHVLHKTDVGGVLVGLKQEELSPALEEMSRNFPGENLLIYHREKIEGPEFILGALNDPSFGPAVMVGAGGIMTELYRDVSFRLAPCSLKDAENMLSELTIAPFVRGYRGSAMDGEKLKEIIERFSHLAEAAAEQGAQLDINPLVWNGLNWTILDAKCVFPI
jgi:succinyl-CoA synthetase beta subunit